MLTQDDLQAIGKIFEIKFDSRFTGIEKRLDSIKIKIDSLETRIGPLETRVGSFETKMGLFEGKLSSLDKKMNQGFKSVDKKLNVIINYFDHQDIDVRKRLNRIELHLGLVSLSS